MKNVELKVNGNTLTITVDLTKEFGPSSSGKTARYVNNKYIERWNQPDAPKTLPMPLQNLYSPMPIMVSTEDEKCLSMFDRPGMREWASCPAGNVVGLIKERKSCRRIMYDMVSQAVEILGTE